MKKYQINYCEHLYGHLEVEANSEDEARELADQEISNGMGITGHADTEISEVIELK